jgi:hypothetical protein
MRLPLLLVGAPPPPLSNPLPHLRNGSLRSATAGGTAGTNSLESFVGLSATIPEFQQYPKNDALVAMLLLAETRTS